MVPAPDAASAPEPTFEEALARLETIVDELESGELPLEDSLQRYEEGMKLSKRLNRTLDQAEKTMERLLERGNDEETPPAERKPRAGTRPMKLDLETGKSESELPF